WFVELCQRSTSSGSREITDAYCRSESKLPVANRSFFRLYSLFESLSRKQSFHPSGETSVRVDSSTARLTIRRRANRVPFFIFVRFGAHSRNTLPAAASSLITGSKLLPAHCG